MTSTGHARRGSGRFRRSPPVANAAAATGGRTPRDTADHIGRLRSTLAERSGIDVLLATLAALRAVEADPLAAPLASELEHEAASELKAVCATERWLIGASIALLDDAHESEGPARTRGWAESAARAYLDALRARPAGLEAGRLSFSRLGEPLGPAKAPAVTGIVQHDLGTRLGTLAGNAPLGRLEGQVECAAGLRVEALAAARRLALADRSPGAAMSRLRVVAATMGGPLARRRLASEGPGDLSRAERLLERALGADATDPRPDDPSLAAAIDEVRVNAEDVLGELARRLHGTEPDDSSAAIAAADHAGGPAVAADGSAAAPSDRAASRNTSPRAA